MEENKKIRPWNHKINYSFEQWCKDNDRMNILNRWDFVLNEKLPSQVSYKSNKKYWFKCPYNKHESELKSIQYLPVRQKELPCIKCGSFAQYVLDNYNIEYFNILCKLNPNIDFWIVPKSSNNKYNIQCIKNPNHQYRQSLDRFQINGCPYCSHHTENLDVKIDPLESLGNKYPESIERWSLLNKLTPYDYYPTSTCGVWWTCENNKHDDYFRKIGPSAAKSFKCPKCGKTNIRYFDENGHGHNWQGGKTDANKLARMTPAYENFRKQVFEKDNYTCQCCGHYSVKLNVHHIKPFAEYKELRTELSNGIVLCAECHDSNFIGSFHNIYGTLNNTPAQLETYINEKRKQLGIDIPFSIEKYQHGDNILSPTLLHEYKNKLKEA